MTMSHWVALIEPAEEKSQPTVSHYVGFPQEISPDGEAPRLLPNPDFLIAEESTDGFFLYRYTRSREFGGDTWHQSLQEAKKQAAYEFGASRLAWRELPADIEDPIAYGAQLVAEEKLPQGDGPH